MKNIQKIMMAGLLAGSFVAVSCKSGENEAEAGYDLTDTTTLTEIIDTSTVVEVANGGGPGSPDGSVSKSGSSGSSVSKTGNASDTATQKKIGTGRGGFGSGQGATGTGNATDKGGRDE